MLRVRCSTAGVCWSCTVSPSCVVGVLRLQRKLHAVTGSSWPAGCLLSSGLRPNTQGRSASPAPSWRGSQLLQRPLKPLKPNLFLRDGKGAEVAEVSHTASAQAVGRRYVVRRGLQHAQ